MAEIATIIEGLIADGSLSSVVGNPFAQFGPEQRNPYLGPTVLPERTVPQNEFTEMGIQYRTVIANDGSRYSPAQIKSSGQIVGEFLVQLGNQDIALEMTPADYDAILRFAASLDNGARPAMTEAASRVLRLVDNAVAGLSMLTEKQRWDAIVAGSVVRVGNNGFQQTITYPNPANHRAAAGGTWSSDAYDPMTDILAMQELFASKGMTVTRMVASTKVARILLNNAKIAQRFAPVRVLSSADLFGVMNRDILNAGFSANGLPALEVYDAVWRDQNSVGRMLSDAVFVMFGSTGGDGQEIENGDAYLPGVNATLRNAVGYVAMGVPVNRVNPGRTAELLTGEGKAASIRAEAWQTSLPVIQHPESIAVINTIS